MPSASEDILYRGFKLSVVHQGGEWLVTIWPTEVEQALPDDGHTPAQAATREEAIEQAKASVDRLAAAAQG